MENVDKSKNKLVLLRWIGVERIIRQMPMVALVTGLALVYIWSAHSAERKLRKINALKTEVQEARWKFMGAKADMMLNTTHSQVERKVRPLNLRSNGQGPYIIK